jgi:CoA-dependent NAD(P)H sulfur oxidoreductase
VQTDRLVIGGGAAGMSAAPAARRSIPFGRSSGWSAAASPAYRLCGLPYYLSGVVRHSDAPLPYPPTFFRQQRRIDLRLHSAVRLDPHRHVVHYLTGGWGHRLGYQRVVVTADGTPTRPSIHGLRHPRAFGVRTLEDVISLRGLLDAGLIGRALVVGTGYLGLEMAAALVHQGVHVVLVELTDRVLGTVDPPLVDLVSEEVRRHGVGLRLRIALTEVRGRRRAAYRWTGRRGRSGDRTRRGLAGRRLDAYGPVAGMVGTALVKVFDLAVARTGLTLGEAEAAGLLAIATTAVGKSRATYYSGTDAVHVRLLYETGGRLLHAQLVGGRGVAKRIDVVAVALHAGLDVDDLTGLDLSYAPHASVYEPVLLAAQAAGAHEPIPA